MATVTPPPPAPEPAVSRETPDDFPFPDWRQSAIAYRGALDAMGSELAARKQAETHLLAAAQQVLGLLARTRGSAT